MDHMSAEREISRPTQIRMMPVLGNVFKHKIGQLSDLSTLP